MTGVAPEVRGGVTEAALPPTAGEPGRRRSPPRRDGAEAAVQQRRA